MIHNILEIENKFADYLIKTFGFNLLQKLDIPNDKIIGERLLYLLNDNRKVSRKVLSDYDNLEVSENFQSIAESLGGDLISVKMPSSTGLKIPRLVDLPGYELIFPIPLKRYLDSNDIQPDDHFSIQWLFGCFHGHDDNILAYIDFRHPFMKAVFCTEYDVEYITGSQCECIVDWLTKFIEIAARHKRMMDNYSDLYAWVKIVQYNDDIQIKVKYKT